MYGGGEGDEYLDFIKYSLKPFIDQHYRTQTGPQNTCLWGSSMGGLISAYGVMKYPETFGKAGVFSPSYWFSMDSLTQAISLSQANQSKLKIIQVAGEKEGGNMKAFIQKITQELNANKIPSSNLKIKLDADGEHNEGYWKREFAGAYIWLFSADSQ
jgi:metallo-beta-lactamase class B